MGHDEMVTCSGRDARGRELDGSRRRLLQVTAEAWLVLIFYSFEFGSFESSFIPFSFPLFPFDHLHSSFMMDG